ncbi:MAG: YeeE/YedE thiosulfate transporter family protein [Bacillota bacterium]
MSQLIFSGSWSPYLVGALIGILSWFSFIISKKPLGTSTSYARGSARLGSFCCGAAVFDWKYYQQYKPELEWQSMLVIGIVIGSFISAVLSGQFSLSFIPLTEFESVLNQNVLGRIFSAFTGGIMLGFGARWAGGCTSGHGISGAFQLSIASWISLIMFFIGGVVTALLIL